MSRVTHHTWWCSVCGSKNSATNRVCTHCVAQKDERYANVRAVDRAVVYYNPLTGEHRTPPRADWQVPEVYASAGFERREIESMTKWEKESGSVHEATNFLPGNEPSTGVGMPKPNRESREAVINDIRDAMASGPWTGADMLQNAPDNVDG